ncbi:hypothetical protein VTK26DRAFT_9196 [Humicola hyalothermophila]
MLLSYCWLALFFLFSLDTSPVLLLFAPSSFPTFTLRSISGSLIIMVGVAGVCSGRHRRLTPNGYAIMGRQFSCTCCLWMEDSISSFASGHSGMSFCTGLGPGKESKKQSSVCYRMPAFVQVCWSGRLALAPAGCPALLGQATGREPPWSCRETGPISFGDGGFGWQGKVCFVSQQFTVCIGVGFGQAFH